MSTKQTKWVHILYSQEVTGSTYTTNFKGALVTNDEGVPPAYCFYATASFEVPSLVFDTPRNAVYAVVGYYTDGDTFGTSHGNVAIVSVYGNPTKAHAVAQALLTTDAKRPPFLNGRYVPWGGYFTSLEKVEVETLVILSDGKNLEASASSADALKLEDW